MKILSIGLILNVAFASASTDLALLKQSVAEALAKYTLRAGVEKLTLANEGAAEENLLVRDELINRFQKPGIEVFYGIAPDTLTYTISYRITELGVYYLCRFKKFPWSPNYITRVARAEFDLVLEKNDQVLETTSLSNEQASVVPERELSLLRSKQFTHEETLTDSPNFWEPILVALVVGALVVAFYGPKTF